VWPHTGPGALTGEEGWTLTAPQFTDMCAVQLSHIMQQSNNGRVWGTDDEAHRIMAEHLGGAALAQFNAAVAEQAGANAEVAAARL
jgi:hypothetical protein